jgi:hypothetical protein
MIVAEEAIGRSGRQLGATLAASAGDDRAASARAHPQPESVRLGTTTVVGLVRTLAHDDSGQIGTDQASRVARAGNRSDAQTERPTQDR